MNWEVIGAPLVMHQRADYQYEDDDHDHALFALGKTKIPVGRFIYSGNELDLLVPPRENL